MTELRHRLVPWGAFWARALPSSSQAAPARPGSCSPVRLVHGQPFHLKPAGAAVVFQVPGTETGHTPHATHELEQRGEVGEDGLQPGEVGAQAVCGDSRAALGASVQEGARPQLPTACADGASQPTKHLLCTQGCARL